MNKRMKKKKHKQLGLKIGQGIIVGNSKYLNHGFKNGTIVQINKIEDIGGDITIDCLSLDGLNQHVMQHDVEIRKR